MRDSGTFAYRSPAQVRHLARIATCAQLCYVGQHRVVQFILGNDSTSSPSPAVYDTSEDVPVLRKMHL